MGGVLIIVKNNAFLYGRGGICSFSWLRGMFPRLMTGHAGARILPCVSPCFLQGNGWRLGLCRTGIYILYIWVIL